MLDRRDFLKTLGVTSAVAAVPLVSAETPDFIKGEIDPRRAVDILAERELAKPTVEEMRMMMRDILNHADHSLPWIGISCLREIIMGVTMHHPNEKFRNDVLSAPEFVALMPVYRPVLKEYA